MVKIEIRVIIQVNNFKGLIGYNFKEQSFIGLQVNNLEFVKIKKLKVALIMVDIKKLGFYSFKHFKELLITTLLNFTYYGTYYYY